MKNIKNPLLINTFYLISTTFIIRILGFLNRIMVTRILQLEGMTLYVLITPTIFLFLTISTISINMSMTKLVSESVATTKYSPLKLLKAGHKLLFKFSIITIILFLISYKFISINLLKDHNLIYPLLCSIPLYIVTGHTDLYKGYFNGIKEIKTSCVAVIIEQIARIFSTIILVYSFYKCGIVVSVCLCVLSDTVGEIISLLYLKIKIKNHLISFENTQNEEQVLFKMALPSTLNHLLSKITLFLEPIIYTNLLINILPTEQIKNFYTIFTAYTLSLITMSLFIPQSLCSSSMPELTEIFVKKKYKQTTAYINKIIAYSLYLGLFITIIVNNYGGFLMKVFYQSEYGVDLINPIVWFFILCYIELPFANAINAFGKTKENFIICSIVYCLKLVFIFVFYKKGLYTIIYAECLTLIIHTIINYLFLSKLINYKLNLSNIFYIGLVFITCFLFDIIINTFINIQVINILLLTVVYLLLGSLLKNVIEGKYKSSSI